MSGLNAVTVIVKELGSHGLRVTGTLSRLTGFSACHLLIKSCCQNDDAYDDYY